MDSPPARSMTDTSGTPLLNATMAGAGAGMTGQSIESPENESPMATDHGSSDGELEAGEDAIQRSLNAEWEPEEDAIQRSSDAEWEPEEDTIQRSSDAEWEPEEDTDQDGSDIETQAEEGEFTKFPMLPIELRYKIMNEDLYEFSKGRIVAMIPAPENLEDDRYIWQGAPRPVAKRPFPALMHVSTEARNLVKKLYTEIPVSTRARKLIRKAYAEIRSIRSHRADDPPIWCNLEEETVLLCFNDYTSTVKDVLKGRYRHKIRTLAIMNPFLEMESTFQGTYHWREMGNEVFALKGLKTLIINRQNFADVKIKSLDPYDSVGVENGPVLRREKGLDYFKGLIAHLWAKDKSRIAPSLQVGIINGHNAEDSDGWSYWCMVTDHCDSITDLQAA